jgi:hypothetical protein
VSARRIILLLTAWLSFDLATPLPGAFEFEIKDSEIEHSMQVDRQAQARRTDASRAAPRERVEPYRPGKPMTPAPAIASAPGDVWVRQIRLAHRPSASRASSLEDH